MTFDEARKKYEENGGHFFEWLYVFKQELASDYYEKQRTFVLIAKIDNINIHHVYGFDKNFEHVIGYGSKTGYKEVDDAIRVAKKPGKQTF